MDATKFSLAERELVLALIEDLRYVAQSGDEMKMEMDLAELQAEALEHLLMSYIHAIKPQVTTTPPAATSERLFSVVLDECGDKKIQVIKETRAIVPGLGLKEAKDLVDKASPYYYNRIGGTQHKRCPDPVTIRENVDEREAEHAVRALEMAGATAHYECVSVTPEEIEAAQTGLVKTYAELSDDGGQAA